MFLAPSRRNRMPRFDLAPEELRSYRPEVRRPADFDDFWRRTLAEARAGATGGPEFSVADTPLSGCRVFDVRFPGFGGEPIAAWLLLPAGDGPHPAVVQFLGYNSGRGLPHE